MRPGADAPRTLVISDAHGYPELIRNALRHGGFRAGEDALVYAGDFVHRGPAAGECVEIVEACGRLVASAIDPDPGDVVVPWGNHDVAVLLGTFTYPNSPPADELRPLFRERFLERRLARGRVHRRRPGHARRRLDGVRGRLAGLRPRPGAAGGRLESEFRSVVAYLQQPGSSRVNPPILGNLGPLRLSAFSRAARQVCPDWSRSRSHSGRRSDRSQPSLPKVCTWSTPTCSPVFGRRTGADTATPSSRPGSCGSRRVR